LAGNFNDKLSESIQAEIERGALNALPIAYYDRFVGNTDPKEGVKTEPESDGCEIVISGIVPHMVEEGMGPGGRGTEGPYDMRKFVLRPGRISQAIPIGGSFRMMSVFGKPWMHRGIKRNQIVADVVKRVDEIAAKALSESGLIENALMDGFQ
jgi:hypothetical protein